MNEIKKRFTIIELLVVIVIITILAGLLLPVLVRAKEHAKRAACKNNLSQWAKASLMHSGDYDSRLMQAFRRNDSIKAAHPNRIRVWTDDGDEWKISGTRWSVMKDYGMTEELLLCPSSSVQALRIYNGPNTSTWWKFVEGTYQYVAGISPTIHDDSSGELNYDDVGADTPAAPEPDGGSDPSSGLIAVDMNFIGGASDSLPFLINHPVSAGLGADYSSHAYADGHVEGARAPSLRIITIGQHAIYHPTERYYWWKKTSE